MFCSRRGRCALVWGTFSCGARPGPSCQFCNTHTPNKGHFCLVQTLSQYQDSAALHDIWLFSKLPLFYKISLPCRCKDHCKTNGNTYYGTQYGKYCACGTARPDDSAKASESACSMTCPGDTSTICGGHFKRSVYEIASGSKRKREAVEEGECKCRGKEYQVS